MHTSSIPLNRLADATRPESDVAREFRNLVDHALVSDADTAADRERIRHWLTQWRANDGAVEPILESSFLLQEAIPLTKDLAALSAAGLEALDSLSSAHKPDADWISRQYALLDNAKPRAELLLMIVPGVRKLVAAASAQR